MEKVIAPQAANHPVGPTPSPCLGLTINGRKNSPQLTFGRPREFLGNRFVYAVISQRARGLSVGVNVNPDKTCNFDCTYCEVNRDLPAQDQTVDLDVLARE